MASSRASSADTTVSEGMRVVGRRASCGTSCASSLASSVSSLFGCFRNRFANEMSFREKCAKTENNFRKISLNLNLSEFFSHFDYNFVESIRRFAAFHHLKAERRKRKRFERF